MKNNILLFLFSPVSGSFWDFSELEFLTFGLVLFSSGQFSEKAQTVTYIYKKNELPIATGKVVVKYIDTDGKSILNDVVRTGTVGEDYITEEKNISGYTFQGIRGNL